MSNVLSVDHPDLLEAAELYKEGWSCVEVAEWFGWSPQTAWDRLRRMGVPMRRAAKRPKAQRPSA